MPNAIWFYVPNLIGYVRVVTAIYSIVLAFTSELGDAMPALWYFISFFLDAFDGLAARRLNQSSTFGAFLDMITDRCCTAALLAILSHMYKQHSILFIMLMLLDISSHWAQMYSAGGMTGINHKKASDNPLLTFYYSFPYALFLLCLFSEGFLAFIWLLGAGVPGPMLTLPVLGQTALCKVGAYFCLPWFVFKQLVSVVQLGEACAAIVEYDARLKSGKAK
eukprot:PLAT13618.1.p2 GENE.PLAT13618.1~~PLAT13618.1.p2  ORF type:complete len:235 (+),score=115.09 PLAT13618.1:45-707(+)